MSQTLDLCSSATYLPIAAVLVDQRGKVFHYNNNYPNHCERGFSHDLYRGSTIFVSLEPCPACLFFLSQKKVKRIVFASYNLNYGACGGKIHLLNQLKQCYRPIIIGGILASRSKMILTTSLSKIF